MSSSYSVYRTHYRSSSYVAPTTMEFSLSLPPPTPSYSPFVSLCFKSWEELDQFPDVRTPEDELKFTKLIEDIRCSHFLCYL
jgi:hypothetical protein